MGLFRGGDPGPAARVTGRVRAGLPPPRADQRHDPPAASPPVTSGAGTLRARLLILFGTKPGLLDYSPRPGAGNLIASIASALSSDSFKNKVLAGIATYQPGSSPLLFSQLLDGQLNVGIDAAGATPASVSCAQQLGYVALNSGAVNNTDTQVELALQTSLNSGSGASAVFSHGGDPVAQLGTLVEVQGRIGMLSQGSDPAAPTGGGILYVKAGALYYRGSSGTITNIAPA